MKLDGRRTRILFAMVLAGVLETGCQSDPVFYASHDLDDNAPTGTVRPLGELLTTSRSLRLVFVHGVGDHCTGYAIDPEFGWLKSNVLPSLGLTATPAGPTNAGAVPAAVYMGGALDLRSYVAYAQRHYSLQRIGQQPLPVTAIEITWSPLTQWIKSNQLGYDSPSTTPKAGAGADALKCVLATDASVAPSKGPPPRLLLDRIIKEQVFDRNLADAILYAGTYGEVIERGVAEALCHAVTGQADTAACVWPDEAASKADTATNIVVTHSIGSRIVYDMFLHLLGFASEARPNPFPESTDAQPFVSQMLLNTPAFYMMANQLALIGLANVPTTARSDTGATPYAMPYKTLNALTTKRLDLDATAGRIECRDVLGAVAQAQSTIAKAARTEVPRLQIVAFNDTNDLLTWHVPNWYANDGTNPSDCRAPVDVVNVFVRNSLPLLVIENPGPAHGNYFTRRAVGDTIRCGATRGKLNACPR